MTHEADTLKAARRMIMRYGDLAPQEVDLRIDELRDRGETDAISKWVEIRKAVRALLVKSSGSLN